MRSLIRLACLVVPLALEFGKQRIEGSFASAEPMQVSASALFCANADMSADASQKEHGEREQGSDPENEKWRMTES
jgi:hypothetical protein